MPVSRPYIYDSYAVALCNIVSLSQVRGYYCIIHREIQKTWLSEGIPFTQDKYLVLDSLFWRSATRTQTVNKRPRNRTCQDLQNARKLGGDWVSNPNPLQLTAARPSNPWVENSASETVWESLHMQTVPSHNPPKQLTISASSCWPVTSLSRH